jgi:signal transduction histidine kinase
VPSRSRTVVLVLLGALLTATFSTTMAYLATRLSKMPQALDSLAILNVAFWFGWATLSFPLFLLARGLRVDRRPRLAVPVHITAVVGASALHVALLTTAQTFVAWRQIPDGVSWWDRWTRTFPVQVATLLDWELVVGTCIVAVAHAFFYYAESRERGLRQANLETRLMEAQLQTLQRQLHPHFLFNTLNAISTLMHRDVPAADRTLVQLGGLLRITLDSVARPQIPLSEELDFLDKFVQIEQTRLGDRLTVAFDVDSDILDAIVPALILQPLVENAIKHGVIPTGRPGRVAVTGHREGGMIVLQVTDDGPGPSERALAALSTGIGVSNTRARLTHQYGARHRFEFHRQPEAFSVLVAFPYRATAQSRSDETAHTGPAVVLQDASKWPCPPEKSVL